MWIKHNPLLVKEHIIPQSIGWNTHYADYNDDQSWLLFFGIKNIHKAQNKDSDVSESKRSQTLK